MAEHLSSNPEPFDLGYPVEEAIADANGWLRGTTMYEGMRGWKAALHVLIEDRARLQSALAEAQRDAERYRWLRDPDNSTLDVVHFGAGITAGDELDAICDAALKEQP